MKSRTLLLVSALALAFVGSGCLLEPLSPEEEAEFRAELDAFGLAEHGPGEDSESPGTEPGRSIFVTRTATMAMGESSGQNAEGHPEKPDPTPWMSEQPDGKPDPTPWYVGNDTNKPDPTPWRQEDEEYEGSDVWSPQSSNDGSMSDQKFLKLN